MWETVQLFVARRIARVSIIKNKKLVSHYERFGVRAWLWNGLCSQTEGKRQREIVRLLKVPQQTVSKAIHRFNELGHEGDRAGIGRKRTVNTSAKKRIQRNSRVFIIKVAYWTFKQDSAPAYNAKLTQEWCRGHFPEFIMSAEWSLYSFDINSMNYNVGSIFQARACATRHKSLKSLRRSLRLEWDRLLPEDLGPFKSRLDLCIAANRGYFETGLKKTLSIHYITDSPVTKSRQDSGRQGTSKQVDHCLYRKMEQGREENPKEPMESDPDSESGGSPTFPKKETTFGKTQEIVPGQEDVTPPPPVSDVLGRLTRTRHQLSAVTGHRERWNRYDGSYEAQSFFTNYDAQADRAQLQYSTRLRKPPNLLQAPLRVTNTRAYLRAKFEIQVRFGSNTQSRHHAHTQELTTEEIQELQSQQHTEVMQVIGFEESEEEVISTSEIKEILGMWERVSQFVEKKHPEKFATGRASDLFNDTCLTHFRNILRGRKKQTSLDMFFSKQPTGEIEKNVAKKAKTSEDI
ncbi:hypothetical protein LAZ67_19000930 [Cordylochernes scorpioides]|uniref:Transposase n=1 Tax=Cordylochernes scorpioides TaxID=51811 RepID=A0ABY6LHE6_9ARAC|nr:hypothetical protein LAZ67_19000930 [Cordylochernes scorpioides]